ncbi:MAG: hypothetical protein WCL44_09665 [bacterium]
MTLVTTGMRWLALVLLLGVVLVSRFYDIQTYPLLGPDEGLWNLEARNAVLFSDRGMNNVHQVFAGPLHFGITWCLFHLVPATCFSVRLMGGMLGVGSLILMWIILKRHYDRRTALWGIVLAGLSFTMIIINRRAYLENGVIFFSLLTMMVSTTRMRWQNTAMALCIALLLSYKSNAIYLLPCLLLPSLTRERRKELFSRLIAVGCGVAGALLVIFLVSRVSPEQFITTYRHELSKGPPGWSVVSFGRFGLSPQSFLEMARYICVAHSDLAIVAFVALLLFVFMRLWRDMFALQMVVWLVGGIVFLGVQWWHGQYVAPLIIPAVLLFAAAVARLRLPWQVWGLRTVAALVILLSVVRVSAGWVSMRRSNPPLAALHWLNKQALDGRTFLACPQVAAGTEAKGYAISPIFLPTRTYAPPTMEMFVRHQQVRYIIYDQWETEPHFRENAEMAAYLRACSRVAEGEGWVAYRTREN